MTRRIIRRLRTGEPLPAHKPYRYTTTDGYVVWRWRVASCEYVEILEHRAVLGNPAGLEVHHKNRDRRDNSADNLVALNSSNHGLEHRSWEIGRALELYRAGHSTPEIGRIIGVNHAWVYRCLRASGIRMRNQSEAQLHPAPIDEIAKLHSRGFSAERIATAVGVSAQVVRRVIKKSGLAPHPVGRRANGCGELRRSETQGWCPAGCEDGPPR